MNKGKREGGKVGGVGRIKEGGWAGMEWGERQSMNMNKPIPSPVFITC